MASKISINLDTSKEIPFSAKCKQNDDLTLEAFIYENGLEVDLTNKEIIIQAVKEDNTYIIQNTNITKEKNKILAELDRDFTRVQGATRTEVVLLENEKQNTTFTFYLAIQASVLKGAVQSSNTVTILEELDNKTELARQVKEETEQLIENGGAATTGQVKELNASLEQNNQELNSKINEVATTGTTIEMVQNKVDEMAKKGLIQAYTLGDNTVIPKKTTFFEYGINLYNPKDESIRDGYYYKYSTGYVTNSAYTTILINGLKTGDIINTNISCRFISSYNATSNSNAVENTNVYTVPDGTSSIVLSFGLTSKNIVMIVKNIEIPTEYVAYREPVIKNENLDISNKKVYSKQIYDKENLILSLKNLEEAVISKNLLSLQDVSQNCYLQTGTLIENTNYNTSGKIYYETNTNYSIKNLFNRVWFFNKNDGVIGYSDTGVSLFKTPLTEGYFRFSYAKFQEDTTQVVKGDTLPEYLPYGYKLIPLKYIQGLENGVNDDFELKLPKEIMVAVGTTIELYNEQICQCGNINNFHFIYTCQKGRTLKRKWEYTPTSNDLGNSSLEVKVYNNNCKLIASQTINIKTIKNITSPTLPIKILQIGDSLSNDKPWYNKVLELSKSFYGKDVINFVGTCGRWNEYKHEGRSGYTSSGYVTNSEYGWQPHIRVQATVTTMPVSKKQYKVDGRLYEFEMSKVENGITWLYFNNLFVNTGSPTTSGVAIATETGTQGDNTINYTNLEITSKNPFWDKDNNILSMSYYTTQTGIKPNIVQIMLGTNGLNGDDDCKNIQLLVDAIRRDWGNIPIHICCIPYYGNQDGLGVQFGNNVLDIFRHKQVFNHHKKIIDTFENQVNVKIVVVGQTMDREYNYGNVETNVNKYNETKELMQVEATHCQTSGYYQFAETMLSNFIDSINTIG